MLRRQEEREVLNGKELQENNRTPASDERQEIWERHQSVINPPAKTVSPSVTVENKSVTSKVDCSLVEWDEVVNSDRAHELLSTSKDNRTILKSHVIRMETDMRNYKYYGDLFGDLVQVSGNWHEDNWHLMNGHHRLQAIKDSGDSVKLKFKQGIPYPLMSSMDQTRARSTNDNLTMQGIGGVNDKASALKLLGKIYTNNAFGSINGKRISGPPTYSKMYYLMKDEIEKAYRTAKKYNPHLRGFTIGTTMIMVMLFDRLAKDINPFIEDKVISSADYWKILMKKTCCANDEDIVPKKCLHPLHKLSKRMEHRDAEAIENQSRKDWHAVWMYEGWLLYTQGIIESKRTSFLTRKTDPSDKARIKYDIPKKIQELWLELSNATARVFPELDEVASSLVSGDRT